MRQISLPRQVGICVRDRRHTLGFTQRQLAERAGVSERLVLSLELGDAPGISLDKLMAVLGSLGLSLYIGDTKGEDTAAHALSKKKDSVDDNMTYADLYTALAQQAIEDESK